MHLNSGDRRITEKLKKRCSTLNIGFETSVRNPLRQDPT